MENTSIENSFRNIGKIYCCEQCGRCSSACPITGIEGFNIRQLIRYVEISQTEKLLDNAVPWLCLTCGRCEEACPNGISILELVRFMRRFVPKKLIPQVPCVEACPVGINIPGFIRLMLEENHSKALELILERTPLPGILGRVCHRPCEYKCRRGFVDSPVSICNLKRYLSDRTENFLGSIYKPGEETNKKILIIGSGPAGLSASYYLRKKGHSVTLIEEKGEAGGMLRYGIPDYRLPKLVLDTEINRIIAMGVDLRTNTKLNNLVDDYDHKLMKDNFDAIFIATGLQSSCSIPLGDNVLSGVMFGLDFLINIHCQFLTKIGKRVLVIGGGNVAVDVAMSAIRLGADNVILACLEKQDDMPADDAEVNMALYEGITLLNSWGLKRFLGSKFLTGVELVNCKAVFDKDNNFNPQFGTRTKTIDVDQVIIAIGQTCDRESIRTLSMFIGSDIETIGSFIRVDSKNKLINSKNVFAGGDIVGGSASVANAVVSGRNVAASIDSLLGGDGVVGMDEIPGHLEFDCDVIFTVKSSYIERQRANRLTKLERTECFSEINGGLSQRQVKKEISRCLSCDLEYKSAFL